MEPEARGLAVSVTHRNLVMTRATCPCRMHGRDARATKLFCFCSLSLLRRKGAVGSDFIRTLADDSEKSTHVARMAFGENRRPAERPLELARAIRSQVVQLFVAMLDLASRRNFHALGDAL